MHMHVIVRRRGDAAWPAPVWGRQPAVPYREDEVKDVRDRLKLVLDSADFRFAAEAA
ncbi:hypothetical protein D3C78_1889360 [compost metagenome]